MLILKKINDKYGHEIGDSVLKSVGEHLKKFFRESDRVFRIGGEEFLVLIHNTEASQSLVIAEKLRMEHEQLSMLPEHTVTVSIGVSGLQSDMDWKDWMKLSDDNLYRAKSNGRNQVFT